MPSKVRLYYVKPVGKRAKKMMKTKKKSHGRGGLKLLAYPRKNGAWMITRGPMKGKRASVRSIEKDKKRKARTRLPVKKSLSYGHRGDRRGRRV